MKKILVIGSGAREHAICQKFIESSSQNNQSVSVFALPGNAGIASIATIIGHIKLSDHGAIAQFCLNNQIDFVFVWPEQPLV
jgi:phosphoribosylamine--glycine ligase